MMVCYVTLSELLILSLVCRVFAQKHADAFDLIISCEMVEHVGHQVSSAKQKMFETDNSYAEHVAWQDSTWLRTSRRSRAC
jgi:cyclopropane fatty-acyl-phospholipid synthase-like methyltransferase